MGHLKCSVVGCGWGYKQIPFYQCPSPNRNLDRFRKWVEATGNPKFEQLKDCEIVIKNLYICFRHFTADDFLLGFKHRLRKDAVPSRNLPRRKINRPLPVDHPLPDPSSVTVIERPSTPPTDFARIFLSVSNEMEYNLNSSDNVSERTETEVDSHKPFRFTTKDSEEPLHTIPPIYLDKSTPEDKEKLSFEPHADKRCAIRDCPNSNFNRLIRYFSFPSDPKLAQRWRDIADNPALAQLTFLQLVGGHFVCWSHFEDNQFENVDKKKLLANQVPRVNLPSQKNNLLRAALEGINLNDEKVVHRPLLDPNVEIKEEIVSDDDVWPSTDKVELNPPIGNQPASQVGKEPIIQIQNYGEEEENPGYVFSSVKVHTEKGPVEMCRICLKPVGSERKLISDYPEEKESISLKHCVNFVLPDLNFDVYPEAYICPNCVCLLKSSYEFKKSWLRTEEVLQKYVFNKDSFTNQPVNVTLSDTDKEITGNQPLHTDGWNDDASFERDETKSIISDKSQKVENREKQLFIINDHDYLTKPRHNKWGILATKIYSETSNIFDSRLDKCFQRSLAVRYFRKSVRRFLRVDWGDGPYLCETCGQMYDKLEQYKRHVHHHQELRNRVPIFTCEVCGVTIENADIRAHYRAKHTPRRFSCNICNRKFVFAHLLNIHKKAKHEKLKPKETSQCHICGVKLMRKSMREHIRRHNPDRKNVECTICGKKFFYAARLRKHIRSHTDDIWNCHICGKKLKYQKSLEKHIRFKHLKQGDSICTICNKLFWDKGKLNEHHRRIHSTESTLKKVKGPEAAGYACSHCGKIFMYQKSLKVHVRTVHLNKGSKCVICDKLLTRESNLREHYIKVHGIQGEKNLAERLRDNFLQRPEASFEQHSISEDPDQDTDKCPEEDVDEYIEEEVDQYIEMDVEYPIEN